MWTVWEVVMKSEFLSRCVTLGVGLVVGCIIAFAVRKLIDIFS